MIGISNGKKTLLIDIKNILLIHFLWKKWSKSHRKAKFRGSLLVVGKTIASHF